MTVDKGKPLSLRAYAAHRGVTVEAVSKAIKKGRLSESVARDKRGHPKIADPDLADREWEASTDLSRAPGRAVSADDGREYSLPHEAAREKHWKANLAELEYQVRAGSLVPVEEVEDKLVERITSAKTKLLGLSRRVQQRLPHIAAKDVRAIHELVREALEDLAHGR